MRLDEQWRSECGVPVGTAAGMTAQGVVLFVAVALLWGIPYGLIKVALDGGTSPAVIAEARIVVGAATLITLALRAGVLRAVRGRIGWLTVYAVLEIAVPGPLLAFSERNISSSLAAILIATTPLFAAVFAVHFDQAERASRGRLVGLAVGFLGVATLVGIDAGGYRGRWSASPPSSLSQSVTRSVPWC